MKPTEMANSAFRSAWHCISGGKGAPEDIRNCLAMTTQGLEALSTGLRATYMKLEEIEALMKKQNAARK
jgi:hypothetical protein